MAPRRGRKARPISARFQGIIAPIGKMIAKPTINGVNAALKNGTPTDNFRSQTNSATNGQMVPIKTTKADTASNRLFATKAVSRLTIAKAPLASSAPARRANNTSDPPMNTPKIIKMNTPRSGSLAKACTDVMTPDRTMKVPISEKPKARMASKIVHAFRLSRFSTTMAECRRAVAISHGMNDAFSTGSQNQKPPQPNS